MMSLFEALVFVFKYGCRTTHTNKGGKMRVLTTVSALVGVFHPALYQLGVGHNNKNWCLQYLKNFRMLTLAFLSLIVFPAANSSIAGKCLR